MRRAIGFGIMILVLKFLVGDVFKAAENTTVQMLETASVVMSNVEHMPPLPR